jgi:hypothetical protein
MDDWMDRMADELGQAHLSSVEVGLALGLARDVARGVERKLAPLAAYLAGVEVGRRVAAGTDRRQAFRDVVDRVQPLVPPAPQSGGDDVSPARAGD